MPDDRVTNIRDTKQARRPKGPLPSDVNHLSGTSQSGRTSGDGHFGQKGRTESFRFLGGLSIVELGRRAGREFMEDDLLGRSAQLSYYFLLAVFPFFLILATLLGYMAQTGNDILGSILHYVGRVAPASAYHLVMDVITETRADAGGGKLSIGILGTLWSASMGVGAIIDGLNKAYEVKEGRPWWKAQLVSIGLTLALGAFVVAALVLILYGSHMAQFFANVAGVQSLWLAIVNIARWPLAIVVVLAAFMIVYRFAPDLRQQRWARTLPGALVAACLWLLASVGLRIYLHLFNTYQMTYGSLGAVITLLLWFYLSGAAILAGGEVNSEVENAAAEEGEPDAKRSGEKVPGERRVS